MYYVFNIQTRSPFNISFLKVQFARKKVLTFTNIRIESFTSVVRLATQVHELSEIERKYWIKFAKLQNTNAIRVYDKEAEHILTHLLLVISLVYQ